MSIESCIIRNAIDGYKIKRTTKTTVLVDEDNPSKGYTKTTVLTSIVAMKLNHRSYNAESSVVSETEYLLNVIYDSTLGEIVEKDIIIEPDASTREVLFVDEYRIGNVIKAYTLYIK